MKVFKITSLLLISLLIFVFLGCEGMNNSSGDIGLDLSGVISRSVGDNITHVKVWLVADGRNNFFELEKDLFPITPADTVIELENIPNGSNYTVYLTLGYLNDDDVFIPKQTAKGEVSVEGGLVNELDAISLHTVNPSLPGIEIRGAAYSNGTTYAISENTLYEDGNPASAASGYTLNDIDLGINDAVFISADAVDGRAVLKYEGGELDPSYSAQLPATPHRINILSSEIFFTETDGDNNDYQIIISQLNAGFIINVLDEPEGTNDWIPIDLEEMLNEAGSEAPGLDLTGELIRGIALVERPNDSVWVYLATKLGNFRKAVSYTSEVAEDLGQDFISSSATLKDRLILNINYVKRGDVDYLFIGTDNGLYSAKVPVYEDLTKAPIVDEKLIAATDGTRVDIVAAGPVYTACVTALDLVIIKGTGDTAETATISFNEGLPANGLLNSEDGISTLLWKTDDTLIVAGANGLAEVNAASLFE